MDIYQHTYPAEIKTWTDKLVKVHLLIFLICFSLKMIFQLFLVINNTFSFRGYKNELTPVSVRNSFVDDIFYLLEER